MLAARKALQLGPGRQSGGRLSSRLRRLRTRVLRDKRHRHRHHQTTKEKAIQKAMIVDVDFHQGDGTASIFANNEDVFTLSVHSEEGWPEEKQKSSLDVPVFEKNKDQYLALTRAAVSEALTKFTPDLVVFVAGSDAYEKDILPGTRYLRLPLAILKEPRPICNRYLCRQTNTASHGLRRRLRPRRLASALQRRRASAQTCGRFLAFKQAL